MQQYKIDFIHFLVRSGALKFGQFKLKSGRVAPIFLNAGSFFTGEQLNKLGEFYAQALINSNLEVDVIFGPAYKGIPLAVATVSALNMKFSKNYSYCFNRKEAKNYGDSKGKLLVGAPLSEETKLVLVDDVITAGTAVRESVEMLKHAGNPQLTGILIMLNRMEKNNDGINAIADLEEKLSVKVFSIVDLDEVIEVLYNQEVDGEIVIDDEKMAIIKEYRAEYGI